MIFGLLSLVFAATLMDEPASGVMTHFASAPQTCAVLQAAYTSASHHKTLIYPRDVRSDTRVLDLDTFVPEYRARLSLSAQEFDELAGQKNQYGFPGFRPVCNWKGDPGPAKDDEGHATFVTFTSPIFSIHREIAIVEVSFREKGIFGYGLLCVVRRGCIGWEAQCQNSWIT